MVEAEDRIFGVVLMNDCEYRKICDNCCIHTQCVTIELTRSLFSMFSLSLFLKENDFHVHGRSNIHII